MRIYIQARFTLIFIRKQQNMAQKYCVNLQIIAILRGYTKIKFTTLFRDREAIFE